MNRLHKCFITALMGTTFCISLVAQSSDQEERLVLPDVTTTVSGDSLVAGKDALPDYSVVLPELRSAKSLLPTLPGVETYDDFDEPVADLSLSWNKSVFCQGVIGCGFPGYFIGDFSVYKETIDSPFSVNFHHLSRNGYGKLPASQGYFDTVTTLGGIKEFSINSFDFNLGAGYETCTLGMQNLSPVFYQLTSQDIAVTSGVKWNLPLNFYMALNNQLEYYSRYGGIIRDVEEKSQLLTAEEKSVASFRLHPDFKIGWKNEYFRIAASVDYDFEKFASDMSEGSLGIELNNRSYVGLNFDWINPVINIGLTGGLVIGNNLSDSMKIVFPFDVKLNGSWDVSYSSIPVTLEVSGGLLSYRNTLGEMEREYAFVNSEGLASETSDWYGKFSLGLPLVKSSKLAVGFDYRKTAFGNMYWTGDYESLSDISGLFKMTCVERTLMDLSVSCDFYYKVFGISARAVNHLMYVPVKEDRIFVEGICNYESDSGKWGTELSLREGIGDVCDLTPNLGVSAYLKVSDALRIFLDLNDFLKLVSGTTRSYAHSDYKQSAGNIILLVNFFF